MKSLFATALGLSCLAAISVAAPKAEAATVTVGLPAIDRTLGDFVSDFAIVSFGKVFPTGTITEWEVYIERIEVTNLDGTPVLDQSGAPVTPDPRVGLMVLDFSPDIYPVKQIDLRTVSVGYNSFSSSIPVETGQILGFYMADAKVSFDLVQLIGQDGFTNWPLPSVPAVGGTVPVVRYQWRDYSINATVQTGPTGPGPSPIPVPAALPLLASALVMIGGLRLRRRAA